MALFTVARGPVPREPSIVPGMAGDRPPPYGGGGGLPLTVARGPVPREAAIKEHLPGPVARGPVPREPSIAPGMAGDRPPPYGRGGAFRGRDAFFIVARGPVPRERSHHRSARACPSRSLGAPEVTATGPRPTVTRMFIQSTPSDIHEINPCRYQHRTD